MNRDDHLAEVLADVAQERRRQDATWGPPSADHPLFVDLGPLSLAAAHKIPTEREAQDACEVARAMGECTMAHILIEEVAEVVGSAADGPARTREELIQVAAVAVKWAQILDMRAGGVPTLDAPTLEEVRDAVIAGRSERAKRAKRERMRTAERKQRRTDLAFLLGFVAGLAVGGFL